jgi:hypothetical protein
MKKTIIALSVMALAGVVWAAGRPGVVRLKDGTIYDGAIEEVEGGLKVNVRGIETNVPRERIASVDYGDFETRWNDEYSKLAKDDAKGRLALARRAFDERKYDLTEKAARDAQAIDPNSAEAADMLKLTSNQRRLERGSGAGNTSGGTNNGNTGANTGGPTAAPPASPWKLLTPEEVNRVKQVEMREDDTKLRINFKNNVRRKYVESDPGLRMNYTEFAKLPQASQAMMIIRNGGDLAKDVEIVNDPEAISAFRTDVMPLVLSGCATSACHNGNNEASKSFSLVTPANNPAAVYSNFVVLKQYRKTVKQSPGQEGSIFAPESAEMIDRTSPEKSLLLQYGLPQQEAEYKHPVVRNYNGVFRTGSRDPKYANIRTFIAGLSKTSADYGFTYDLQRQDAASPEADAPPSASRPATTPAAGGR